MLPRKRKAEAVEKARPEQSFRFGAARSTPDGATTGCTGLVFERTDVRSWYGVSTESSSEHVSAEASRATAGEVTGLFFERPDVRAWYSGASHVLPPLSSVGRGNHVSVDCDEDCILPQDDCEANTKPGGDSQSINPSTERVNADVFNDAELQEFDNDLAFMIPSKSRTNTIKAESIQCMAHASDPTSPCSICELSYCQSEVTTKVLTDEFSEVMHQCLKVHPDASVPDKLKAQYDASDIDPRLEGLLLYRPAITKVEAEVKLRVCDGCRQHVECGKYTEPPPLAIANGNYTGHLPRRFHAMTRTDEQAVALVLPCVSLSVVTGGACKTIKSHHYVVHNTEGSIVEMLPRDLSSRVRVAMVGAMTPEQTASCKKRYNLNLELCNQVLRFLKKHNCEYQNGSQTLTSNIVDSHTARTSVIIDRTHSMGQPPEGDRIVAAIRDESTYSAFGSMVEEGVEHGVENTWIGASSLLSQPHRQNYMDVLVRKSNVYVPMAKWAVCVRMFPSLFPFGCGGTTEPRLTPLSVRRWILRCLQVDGHRFEKHYAFLLLAFDFLATQEARRTMYVKLNIKRHALKAGSLPRSTLREAIQYFNHITQCRQKGIKPRPPSNNVQRVIDLRKGLYIPESAFYGSNIGRMRARHDLFGLLKRFGPLQVFFTVSPDSAGTYNIAIKTGVLAKSTLDEANMPLVPNRAERKAVAAAHPVECARYFLRVMKTVIEVLLGWDTKARAPKRGGGIFGVVRAFGAAAETQVAGDLHAHFAVWLHGFPTTTLEYISTLQTNVNFKERILRLADKVLCTKPPCIRDDQQCPVCSSEAVLEPVVPGIDAFRRPAPGSSPPLTARCKACNANFGDKDIIDLWIRNLADRYHLHIDSQLADFEKCRPPSTTAAGDLATSLLVRDVQVHYWNHCKSCFKATVRTPKASVCRFFKPEEVHLGPTSVDDGSKLRLHRAVGCEYVNAYNPVVMETLKCNHDAQFVFCGSRDTAAYVAKYCFKRQNPVENQAALSLAAFAKASNTTNALPPETTAIERGYRILGSMLYSLTNGQEVAATMAALYVLNESPFWFSHEFVHVDLRKMLKTSMESLEISFSQQSAQDDGSGAANISTTSALERYWKRESSLDNVSFIELCENYECSGKRWKRTSSDCSNEAFLSFSKLKSSKVLVLCGDEIPDITSHLSNDKHDYYYAALLTMFKPHRECTLVADGESLLGAYRSFLQSGDSLHVEMLRKYEAQWQDYHHSQRSTSEEEESLEEQLLRSRGAPTSSWVPGRDENTSPNASVDNVSELIPEEFLDCATVTSPDTSTTKLCENAVTVVGEVSNIATAVSTASAAYCTSQELTPPEGFSSASYTSQIVMPFDEEVTFGTQEFVEAFPTARTRLERLSECYGPVPFEQPPVEPQWTPDTLPRFPKIAMVSQAFRLNFWQHVIFEMAARHLLYAYSRDVDEATGDASTTTSAYRTDPYAIQSQLIAYLGGEAGTGKSTVVEALLAVAKCWGREGSVETLAFTGAAAINIHGKTMHSARNLRLNGAEPNSAPSSAMKARFGRVILVIVDEISITHQALLGGTDSVSRSMSRTPNMFMGGRHVLLIGDFLQLPPVGGRPCYQAPDCTANRLCHAGYALYSAINFVVFLTKNMRARLDPAYADILDDLRWGRLSDTQLALLNSRVQSTDRLPTPPTSNSDMFYRPIVVCTNKLRCAINHLMIFRVARAHRVTVYECMARPSSRSASIVANLANAPDDLTSRVPMKLLFYIGMPAMVTRKHPDLIEADVVANGVIGTIVGMYPSPDQLRSTRYSVEDVVVSRLIQLPELLFLKIHGCLRTLVDGFPPGVIGLPPLHAALDLKRIPNLARSSITVDQFAAVPAFACTTEKLQGQTCHDGVVVTPLDRRKAAPKQTFYVALSRATSLAGLTLTEKITRKYLQNFQPDDATVTEMLRLIGMVRLPPYISPDEEVEFRIWKARQHV